MKIEIIVAYNTQVELTKEFLDTMQKTTEESKHEVICTLIHGYVADEEDIQHPFVKKFFKLKNEGFCKTLNEGLKNIDKDTDYIFFVGNDSFPTDNYWLDDLVDIARQNNFKITCPADQESTKKQRPYIGKQGGILLYDFYPSIAWLIPKYVIDEIGLLDERLTGAGYYADNDYCRRIVNRFGQAEIGFVKHIVLEHRTSSEGRAMKITGQMDLNRKQYGEICNE